MARLFNDAASDYLSHAAAVVSGSPCTIAAWVNLDDLSGSSKEIVVVGVGGSANNHLRLNVAATTGVVRAISTTTANAIATAGSVTVNTWAHCGAVFASGTSRTAYKDGTPGSAETTSNTPSGFDTTNIGRHHDPSFRNYVSGQLAEVAIWNAALTTAEMASLSKGLCPLLVRPDAIVAYWPLIGRTSPEIDVVGGFGMTVTGATAAEHPRIYLPSSGLWIPPAADAAQYIDNTTPILMHILGAAPC